MDKKQIDREKILRKMFRLSYSKEKKTKPRRYHERPEHFEQLFGE